MDPRIDLIATARWQKIRAVVLDIDGVLTDGRMGYGDAPGEVKFFHVRDGHGIKLALRAGLMVGALSGRRSTANRRRADELGFTFLYEASHDKLATFKTLLAEHQLDASECLYVGDDVVDLPVMRRVGIAATVGDAPEYMDRAAAFRTVLAGGHGAVREILELLLTCQGHWPELMKRYEVD